MTLSIAEAKPARAVSRRPCEPGIGRNFAAMSIRCWAYRPDQIRRCTMSAILRIVLLCCAFLGACSDPPTKSLVATSNDRQPTSTSTIWLAGVDPYVRHLMAPRSPSDYLDLFTKEHEWPRSAAKIGVFKTSTQYLMHASDDDLRLMISELRRLGIALGFEALMTPQHEQCGAGIEGYSAPGAIKAVAERVKRLGGTISYAAMDEPLEFGHHDQAPNACQSSIEAVASQVAENVAALRQIFPDIKIGDIEPFGSAMSPIDWSDEIIAFGANYRKATGTPLDFVDLDVDWTGNLSTGLPGLASRIHAEGSRFGIIYNGDPTDEEDIAWTSHATERFEYIEDVLRIKPDDAVLQTWMQHPAHFLPESVPGTMTNLVLNYTRPASNLRMQSVNHQLIGKLTAADGAPIAGKSIDFFSIDPNDANTPSPHILTGTVPADAKTAMIGLRVDTECNCSGRGEMLLGAVHYQDDGGVDVIRQPLKGAPNEVQRVHASPEKPLAANTAAFGVMPGHGFRLSASMDANSAMADSGYVMLVFFDSSGKEIRRLRITPSPSEILLTSSTTGADGSFKLDNIPKFAAGVRLKAVFEDTDELRGSRTSVNF